MCRLQECAAHPLLIFARDSQLNYDVRNILVRKSAEPTSIFARVTRVP